MINVVPYGDRVIVRLLDPKTHSKAGLEIHEFDADQTDTRIGEIVALPDNVELFDVGDWVMFNRHAYIRYALTDDSGVYREYGVVRFVDIVAVATHQVVEVVDGSEAK